MPKVTEQYRAGKREEIARAALRAFGRTGFKGTSMADVIAESGLSAGAIYGHFSSKEELILDVAGRIVTARIGDAEALASADPMPPPGALVRVLMNGMEADLGATSMLVQMWGEAVTDPEMLKVASRVPTRLLGIFFTYISLWQQREHALSETEADEVAHKQASLFVAACQGYIVQSALFKDFDDEKYLATVEKYLPR